MLRNVLLLQAVLSVGTEQLGLVAIVVISAVPVLLKTLQCGDLAKVA